MEIGLPVHLGAMVAPPSLRVGTGVDPHQAMGVPLAEVDVEVGVAEDQVARPLAMLRTNRCVHCCVCGKLWQSFELKVEWWEKGGSIWVVKVM